MTNKARVGFLLRLEPELSDALDRIAPRRTKTAYIARLIRRDLQRRGELPRDDKK